MYLREYINLPFLHRVWGLCTSGDRDPPPTLQNWPLV